MTILNRRAVASGALALTAILTASSVTSAAHGPASMLEARHPDHDIAALFVQWVRTLDAVLAVAKADDFEDLHYADPVNAILAKISATHATTIEGIAIKAYLSVHHELGADVDANITWDGGMMVDAEPHRSLVRDAVAASPLLAAFVTPDGVRRRA